MKKYRYLRNLFSVLAVLLSDVMCAVVAYHYCALQWCGQYAGCSAPAHTAFLLCIPYGIGIMICVALAWLSLKKYQNSQSKGYRPGP